MVIELNGLSLLFTFRYVCNDFIEGTLTIPLCILGEVSLTSNMGFISNCCPFSFSWRVGGVTTAFAIHAPPPRETSGKKTRLVGFPLKCGIFEILCVYFFFSLSLPQFIMI